MSKKLFVGRLPFDFTDEKLGTLFASAGTVVSAQMIPDPKQGRTRGFGFVDMKTEEEAQTAIGQLNGYTIGDRQIWVAIARPKTLSAPATPSTQNAGNEGPALHTTGGRGRQTRGAPDWKRRSGFPSRWASSRTRSSVTTMRVVRVRCFSRLTKLSR